MNLYQITNEYQKLLSGICDEETGEINEQELAKLDQVADDIKNKGIAIASFIKNIDADREAIEKAKKAMAEREARLNRRVESLTNYLKTNMELCGIDEISCPYFAVRLKKNPASVNVIDESAIPKSYFNEKTTLSLDKMKIKQKLLEGEEIPGAAIKHDVRLEIR